MMKTLTDIFQTELRTRDDIKKVVQTIAMNQRDTKRVAIDYMLEDWTRLLEAEKQGQSWFIVLPFDRCAKRGGVILERVGPFSRITCGGNRTIGCPACSTIGSSKMMSRRTDIITIRGDE